MSPLRANSSIPLSTEVKMFRVEITVNRGLANFQLHAILSYGGSLTPQSWQSDQTSYEKRTELGISFQGSVDSGKRKFGRLNKL